MIIKYKRGDLQLKAIELEINDHHILSFTELENIIIQKYLHTGETFEHATTRLKIIKPQQSVITEEEYKALLMEHILYSNL